MVLLVPLPVVLIDLLLIANITLAVIVLLTTLNIKTPLEFSVFPSMLLAATLGRLVINVATTRQILSHGHEGVAAAGGVIQGFGQFVSADNIIVGAVIFLVILVIQFVVITKGSTRISEVAARFLLDSLPGKQMAIDAELSSGNITAEQASEKRDQLAHESDFYGAMDGASKYVRGDAIAALVITAINIVGGLLIGIMQGMPISDATATFTKLTIGDGLASQIPSFLIAIAAGMLITRTNRKSDFSLDFVTQLVSRPQVLAVAGGFVCLLIFTNLPMMPSLVIGSCCMGLAFLVSRQSSHESSSADESESTIEEQPTVRIEDYLAVDPMEIEVGIDLIPLADPSAGGDLLDRINRIRQSIATELGIILPKVRVRDNLALDGTNYKIRIFNNPIAEGTIFPDKLFAIASGSASLDAIEGQMTVDPLSGRSAKWIDPLQHDMAKQEGCQISVPAAVLASHLATVSRRSADLILTREATGHLINEVKRKSPTIVEELIPNQFRLADVQNVLQTLLRESISIRHLEIILESLGDLARQDLSRVELIESVRQKLAPQISSTFADRQSNLNVLQFSAELEELLTDHFEWIDEQLKSTLPASERELIISQIEMESQNITESGIAPVVLVSPANRPTVRALIAESMPGLVILSTSELTPDINVVPLTTVQLTAAGFSDAC